MRARDDAYTAEYYEQYENTIRNGETRLPICFVLDVSQSMNIISDSRQVKAKGKAYELDGVMVQSVQYMPGYNEKNVTRCITSLRRVLKRLLDGIYENPFMRNSVVVSIITFSKYANRVLDFSELKSKTSDIVSTITTEVDVTNTHAGIDMALDSVKAINDRIKEAGNESYRPVIVLITDGMPTTRDAMAEKASKDLYKKAQNGEVELIPIFIGQDSMGFNWLQSLTPHGRIYQMIDDHEFDEVFEIITRQIKGVTNIIAVDATMNDNNASSDANSTAYGSDFDLVRDLIAYLDE